MLTDEPVIVTYENGSGKGLRITYWVIVTKVLFINKSEVVQDMVNVYGW